MPFGWSYPFGFRAARPPARLLRAALPSGPPRGRRRRHRLHPAEPDRIVLRKLKSKTDFGRGPGARHSGRS